MEEYTPIEIEYGPGGNVPLEVFDGFIFLYGKSLTKSTVAAL